MRTIISFIFILVFIFNGLSQNKKNNTFPESWLGTYQGKMQILWANADKIDSVDVTFEFSSTQNPQKWTYKITYKSPKYGDMVKDYELIKPDSLANDSYLLDEKDGIFIEVVVMGNTLYSAFSVAESRLVSILRKEGNELFMEIFTSKDKNPLISKNKADKPEEVFEVKSFAPFTTQFVRFRKVK